MPLKPVLLRNHSLLLQIWHNDTWSEFFFKKLLIGTEFRGTLLLANQIPGFFKVRYRKKKVTDEVDFLYVN